MLGATFVKKWCNGFEVFATDKENFVNSPAKKFMAFDLVSESYDALMNWAKPDVLSIVPPLLMWIIVKITQNMQWQ